MSDAEAVKAWETDLSRERPSRDELSVLYRQYATEGHFVVFGHVRGDRPLYSWIAWCVGGVDSECSAASFGNRHDPWSSGVELLSYDEAKWWGRSHRTLWLLFVIDSFAYRTLALSESATEVSLLASDEFATYLLVAIGFAFLSLILPSRLNRLTNMVAGTGVVLHGRGK